MNNYNLYHGDCLEEMNKISDKSIDMILCDLPYGTTDCKWDFVIPFDLVWKQINRIVKDNTCIALFGNEPFSTKLRMSNIVNYRYDYIWIKNSPTNFMNANKQPLKKYENICIFYNKLPNYNPVLQKKKKESIRFRNYSSKKHNINLYNETEKKRNHLVNSTRKIPFDSKYPDNVLYYDIVNRNIKLYENRDRHPTEKPVLLLEHLIKTYSNENEIVLDFTMGSGSTGVACMNTNRKFIGIEKDEKYFNIAKKRIEQSLEGIF
jgi:DNA modification methylase